MIDYSMIGLQIRKARLKTGMTQEQLANAIDVGVTHISHIETGNTIPSMKTFVKIINVLGCSADEILCCELASAKPIVRDWLSELLANCSPGELKVLIDTLVSVKASLRKNMITED